MWGGVIIHASPGIRYFHHIEMFSVVKLKKSFWSAAGCAGYYFAFMHCLTWVGEYNNICSESSRIHSGIVIFGSRGGAAFCVTVVFESFLRCIYL